MPGHEPCTNRILGIRKTLFLPSRHLWSLEFKMQMRADGKFRDLMIAALFSQGCSEFCVCVCVKQRKEKSKPLVQRFPPPANIVKMFPSLSAASSGFENAPNAKLSFLGFLPISHLSPVFFFFLTTLIAFPYF